MIHHEHEINFKNLELDYLYYKAENDFYEKEKNDQDKYYCNLCKWPDIDKRMSSFYICEEFFCEEYFWPDYTKFSEKHERSKYHQYHINNEYIITEQRKAKHITECIKYYCAIGPPFYIIPPINAEFKKYINKN